MEKRMTLRDKAKIATREKAVTAARKAFSTADYNSATIRSLAKEMGMSTGAIFANFDSKADLWRASMGCEPPVDDTLTRARFMMRDALTFILANEDARLSNDARAMVVKAVMAGQ